MKISTKDNFNGKIKVFIIAGSYTRNLVDTLTSSSALEVIGDAHSIHACKEEIISEPYTGQKLIFLYTGESKIALELSALNDLLTAHSTFFNFKEVYLYVKVSGKNDPSHKFCNLFVNTLKDRYKIHFHSFDKIPDLADLHDSIIGKTVDYKVSNPYVDVFRVERGNDDTVYERDINDIKSINNLTDRETLDIYKETQSVASKSKLPDNYSEHVNSLNIVEEFNNPVLNQIKFESLSALKNIVIITGAVHSGLTTFTVEFGRHAKDILGNCTLINLTAVSDMSDFLYRNNDRFYLTDIKKFITDKGLTRDKGLSVINTHGYKNDIRLEALRYLLKFSDKLGSVLVLETPLNLLDEVLNITGVHVSRVVICSENKKKEFKRLENIINKYKNKYPLFMFLNEYNLESYDMKHKLDSNTIKNFFKFDIKLISSIDFSDEDWKNIKDKGILYTSIMEVE